MANPEQGELELGVASSPRQQPRPGLTAELWHILLTDVPTVSRYRSYVHTRAPDACFYWTGAIGDSAHGKFRAGSREAGTSRVVTAHVYGWRLHALHIDEEVDDDLVVRHTCDEASCQNPAHWKRGDRAANVADYLTRRHRDTGPLADLRGPQGRAEAIRDAIRKAKATGADIETAIAVAIAAGEPTPLRLL